MEYYDETVVWGEDGQVEPAPGYENDESVKRAIEVVYWDYNWIDGSNY